MQVLEGHTRPVSALAVLADGWLASGSWDDTIRLWNPANVMSEATLEGRANAESALAVLADGRLAPTDNTIGLHGEPGKTPAKIPAPPAPEDD